MPRNKKRLKAGAVILCAGLLYGYVLIPLGLRIPCPVRALTGLRCPGCGVTDACLAVLHGRFWEAPAYNWGLTLSAPAVIYLVVRTLRGSYGRAERVVCGLTVAFLAGWTVVRNLYGL